MRSRDCAADHHLEEAPTAAIFERLIDERPLGERLTSLRVTAETRRARP
jgi:hypothetical protein